MTTISFVIPTYNNLRYVTNAYRSIRKHCGDQHEIIILDEESPLEEVIGVYTESLQQTGLSLMTVVLTVRQNIYIHYRKLMRI